MPEEEYTQAEEVAVEDHEEDPQNVLPFQYSIVSYGADYPVDGLVKRVRSGDIFIPPFQRSYVWSYTQASRFIESLLLGLPVPGIFLSREEAEKRMLVIDGHQRLKTLRFYYDGLFKNRRFVLRNVQDHFEGLAYDDLPAQDKRRLDDSIVHATVVRQVEPSDDDSSIYHIFERINTGGAALRPQEIRACIYHGPFNDALGTLNQNSAWRGVYGTPSARMKDQELILRFFALYYWGADYKKPMKQFLNRYMAKNRNLTEQSEEELRRLFTGTVTAIESSLGKSAFRPERALNAAVYDAVMVGLAKRLKSGLVSSIAQVRERYESLLSDEEFMGACKTATTDELNVATRNAKATDVFKSVE